MNRILPFAVMMAACLAFTNASASSFNNGDFKGGYAFRLAGLSSMVQANEPRTVATGVLVADGKGHVTGHGTFRSAGVSCVTNIAGTYSVSADGTGVLTSNTSSSTPGCVASVIDLAMVLTDAGKTIEVANTENDYMSGNLITQEKDKFKLNDLKGDYALRLAGPSSVASSNESYTVGVGLITADGQGNITGSGSLRSAGVTCQGVFVGNYLVDTDGTGTIATKFNTSMPGCYPTVVDLSAALFDKGKAVDVANSDNDYMAGSLILNK